MLRLVRRKAFADDRTDTEIDWKAYMQQIEVYLAGERDYSKIYGDTGPLVYPAMHVYIYRWLHEFTQGGSSILTAQVFFVFLYIFNLGLVMACYRRAKVSYSNPFHFQQDRS